MPCREQIESTTSISFIWACGHVAGTMLFISYSWYNLAVAVFFILTDERDGHYLNVWCVVLQRNTRWEICGHFANLKLHAKRNLLEPTYYYYYFIIIILLTYDQFVRYLISDPWYHQMSSEESLVVRFMRSYHKSTTAHDSLKATHAAALYH